MITAENLQIWVGSRELLHDLNFKVHVGQRVAIVGANGSGKTTLINCFKQTPAELKLNFGDALVVDPVKKAWVEQDVPNLDIPALEYVIQGDMEFAYWSAQLEQAMTNEDTDLIIQANAKLDELDAWTIRSRASIIMLGLGFTQENLNKPVNSLSGGWRIRLNLARAILVQSDLLLLDEPTNHLDIDAIYWLEEFLKRYQGTIVFISHDQEFMDNIADHVLHIENGTITSYTGNYSSFLEQRNTNLAIQEKQYANQQKHIAQVQRFIERFRFKATKAKQAQSRIRYLDKLKRIDPVSTKNPFNFSFADGGRLPAVISTFRNASLGYESGKPVLTGVNFSIHLGMRFGLLGLNGAGKSTLVKAFAGELDALDDTGVIQRNDLAKIGYFNQYVVDKLDVTATPMEVMRRLDPKLSEADARKFLAGFNFTGDKVFETIGNFSGGEKSRLSLALIVYQKPNFLLLDEPTNHLDLEMRQALATALQEFQGSLIVVSHDRFLLGAIVEEFYLVHNGKVQEFDGNLDDYHSWVVNAKAEQAAQLQAEQASKASKASQAGQGDSQSHNSHSPTQQNSSTQAQQQQDAGSSTSAESLLATDTRLQKELQRLKLPTLQKQRKLDTQLQTLREELAKNFALYEDPIVVNDSQKIQELGQSIAKLEKQIATLEEEWFTLEMELEEIEAEFIAKLK